MNDFNRISLLGDFFVAINEAGQLWFSTDHEQGKEILRQAIFSLRLSLEDDDHDDYCDCGCDCRDCRREDDPVHEGILRTIRAVEEKYGLSD